MQSPNENEDVDLNENLISDEEEQFISQAVAFCPQCLSTVEQMTDEKGATIFTCSSYPKCDFKKTLR